MKNFFLFCLAIGLSILLTPFLGGIYEFIIGHPVRWATFIGPSHPEYVEGFFMGFVFFITFLLHTFGTSMKNYVIVFSLIPFILINLLARSPLLLIDLSLIVIALILSRPYLWFQSRSK